MQTFSPRMLVVGIFLFVLCCVIICRQVDPLYDVVRSVVLAVLFAYLGWRGTSGGQGQGG